jgi:hypothetical protein
VKVERKLFAFDEMPVKWVRSWCKMKSESMLFTFDEMPAEAGEITMYRGKYGIEDIAVHLQSEGGKSPYPQ